MKGRRTSGESERKVKESFTRRRGKEGGGGEENGGAGREGAGGLSPKNR